ncbi:MAG: hypothetical protein ACYDCD_02810 [Candidatus Acidiferrales bacterium]
MKRLGLLLAILLLFAAAARADEFHLKDGSTVIGTIVGYQGNSFRVKTSYGFALVDRSAIVSITVSKPSKPADAKEKTRAPENSKPATPTSASIAKNRTPIAAKHEASTKPMRAAKLDAGKKLSPKKRAEADAHRNARSQHIASAEEAKKSSPAEKAKASNASAALHSVPVVSAKTSAAPANFSGPLPAVSRNSLAVTTSAAPAASPTPQPPKQIPATAKPTVIAAAPTAPATVPAPIPVREEVQGNLYINDTYGFRIYKPPDWNVINGARAALPGAVVAMGTSDQTTYLIIGLEHSTGTLRAHVTSTNERLSNMFEQFRPLAAKQTMVAGLRAYEYQFQGMANDQQWSGTVVVLNRGDNFFTIFGVTSANTDLVQIQQNVISRTISSLQFTKP